MVDSPANDNVDALSLELAEQLDVNSIPKPIDPSALPVRFSRLKRMALSAAHYYSACQQPANDNGLALRLGSGTHAMILGTPEVVKYPARRAGKAWESFKAANGNAVILSPSEWRDSQRMASAILTHREAMRLLFEDATNEQHLDWEWLGRKCSSRPDAYSRYHVVELKTARSSQPFTFVRDGLRMHYHAQLAYYRDAIEYTTGIKPPSAYVVAVEKTDPCIVTVFKLTDRALEAGEKLNRLWFETLLQCEASNHWSGYSESLVDFDVPDEQEGSVELEIDGEMVEVA